MTESPGLFRFAAVVCVVYSLAFAAVAYEHVRYPGFTEAMEGDVLQHVARAASGRPIYPPATGEYIPLAYFPGYYYLAAPFYWLFGDDLRGPRLVSCLCSFLAALAFAGIVYQESRSTAASLLTVALFFAGYRIKDENLTTALPDAALLMWLSFAWAMLVGPRTAKRDFAASLFLFAAFWTKQQGALLAAWSFVYMWFVNPVGGRWFGDRRVFALTAILYSVGLAVFFGSSVFGERTFHFTVEVPGGWDRSYVSSIQRFVLVTFLFVPFAWLASGVFAFRDGVRFGALRNALPYLIATTAATCLYTVAATGSSNNHYIPLFSLLEVAAALGTIRILAAGPPPWLPRATAVAGALGVLVAVAAAWKNEDGHPLPLYVAGLLVGVGLLGWLIRKRLGRRELWAAMLLGGQFGASFYLPWDYFPPPRWREALADFRREPEYSNTFAWPDYGAIPTTFGDRAYLCFPSWVALEDVTRSRRADPRDIAPFHERMKDPPKWLITCDKLESIPVWREHATAYQFFRSFGSDFAALPQLCRHWYGGRIYPRFLYRRSENP